MVYEGESVTVEPHFCRTYDDCGHEDNTLEDIADKIAEHYQYLADCWKNKTHPTYTYYKNQEGNT